jgi:hypothetical protein
MSLQSLIVQVSSYGSKSERVHLSNENGCCRSNCQGYGLKKENVLSPDLPCESDDNCIPYRLTQSVHFLFEWEQVCSARSKKR